MALRTRSPLIVTLFHLYYYLRGCKYLAILLMESRMIEGPERIKKSSLIFFLQ
jgi:hypothetical protein